MGGNGHVYWHLTDPECNPTISVYATNDGQDKVISLGDVVVFVTPQQAHELLKQLEQELTK